jgi:hypothetical protein
VVIDLATIDDRERANASQPSPPGDEVVHHHSADVRARLRHDGKLVPSLERPTQHIGDDVLREARIPDQHHREPEQRALPLGDEVGEAHAVMPPSTMCPLNARTRGFVARHAQDFSATVRDATSRR